MLVSGTLIGNGFLCLSDGAFIFAGAAFASAVVGFVFDTCYKPGRGGFVIAGIGTFDEIFGGSVFKRRMYTSLNYACGSAVRSIGDGFTTFLDEVTVGIVGEGAGACFGYRQPKSVREVLRHQRRKRRFPNFITPPKNRVGGESAR